MTNVNGKIQNERLLQTGCIRFNITLHRKNNSRLIGRTNNTENEQDF